MNQSESINELASALAKAQGEMQAAVKDATNPFFKTKYADLGNVWEACRPVLSKNGLCVMQYTELCADGLILVTMLAHASGQWLKSQLPLRPAKQDAQGIGAAITYMRRYSLSAIVGVVTSEDNDDDGETACGRGETAAPKKTEQVTTNKILPTQQAEFIASLKSIEGTDLHLNITSWIKKKYNTDNPSCLTVNDFNLLANKIASHSKEKVA